MNDLPTIQPLAGDPLPNDVRHPTRKFLSALALALPLAMPVAALAAGPAAKAKAPPPASLPDDPRAAAIRDFARCDASFFATLGREPGTFGKSVELLHRGPLATPLVQDPWAEGAQRVQRFKEPIEVGGLQLVGWRSDAAFVPGLGTFIWWGFVVEGRPDPVAAAVNRLLPPPMRLVRKDGSWTRGEARYEGDPPHVWKRAAMPLGVLPKRPGAVDRVLVVEPAKEPGRTGFYCTLQGAVTDELLERLRPELPERPKTRR
jgi:hypothetical protein